MRLNEEFQRLDTTDLVAEIDQLEDQVEARSQEHAAIIAQTQNRADEVQQMREANEQLETANEKKRVVEELVADLNAKLAVLQASYDKAMAEKAAAEADAARSARRLDLANRLINALGANV